MSPFYRGSYARRAERLVMAIRDGEIRTPGQGRAFVDSLASLPVRLQRWVLESITPLVGYEGVEYLRSLLPAPVAEVSA
jgi:hypothetical protein